MKTRKFPVNPPSWGGATWCHAPDLESFFLWGSKLWENHRRGCDPPPAQCSITFVPPPATSTQTTQNAHAATPNRGDLFPFSWVSAPEWELWGTTQPCRAAVPCSVSTGSCPRQNLLFQMGWLGQGEATPEITSPCERKSAAVTHFQKMKCFLFPKFRHPPQTAPNLQNSLLQDTGQCC